MSKKTIDEYVYNLKVGLVLCNVLIEVFEKRKNGRDQAKNSGDF